MKSLVDLFQTQHKAKAHMLELESVDRTTWSAGECVRADLELVKAQDAFIRAHNAYREALRKEAGIPPQFGFHAPRS